MAFRTGIVGLTKKNGNTTGCVCHGFKPFDSVSVILSGPETVNARDTAIYTLSIANGPAIAGGCDISTSLGNVYPSALDTILRRAESFPGSGFELTHKEPKLFTGDTLKFLFKYVAPDTSVLVIDTLFANGNSVNLDTTSENDHWNYARNFTITVTPVTGIVNNSLQSKSFELSQNYPNPFNPETKINFSIRNSSNISFLIFDASGKEIAKLVNNKFYNPGNYSISFNAEQFNISSGVYFYKLAQPGYSLTKSMLFIK